MRRFVCVAAVAVAVPLLAQTVPCARVVDTLDKCPAIACAVEHTADAELNRQRNSEPHTELLWRLTLDDFEKLQKAVSAPQGFAVRDRGVFRHVLTIRYPKAYRPAPFAISIGEGDMVEVTGFIVGTPHATRADPATCMLIGVENNSYRLNIARNAGDSEYDSIVVEMVPHYYDAAGNTLRVSHRPADLLAHLEAIRREGREVRVRGKLLYNNKHLVNSNPDDPLPGEAKRMSLWEIHPVMDIRACPKTRLSGCQADKDADWLDVEEAP